MAEGSINCSVFFPTKKLLFCFSELLLNTDHKTLNMNVSGSCLKLSFLSTFGLIESMNIIDNIPDDPLITLSLDLMDSHQHVTQIH